MKTGQLAWAVLTLLLVASAVGLISSNRAAAVNGQAVEIDPNRKASVKMKRQGEFLQVELLYFPSYESTFEKPTVVQEEGKTVVVLRSFSPGLFQRKSEQQTNLSFKVPASFIETGSTIHFRSGDYDQVFAIGEAP